MRWNIRIIRDHQYLFINLIADTTILPGSIGDLFILESPIGDTYTQRL